MESTTGKFYGVGALCSLNEAGGVIVVDAFDDYADVQELKYYISDGKIANWQYSPEGAIKQVATKFE